MWSAGTHLLQQTHVTHIDVTIKYVHCAVTGTVVAHVDTYVCERRPHTAHKI